MTTLNKNNSPIGFFDSGVGGLTVLDKVRKLLPNESFLFYGDTVHVPYGEKSKSQLLDYAAPILRFFEKKGCKAVVMACNTTSSVIYNEIKDKYKFKLYPIVQSVGKIIADLNYKRVGVLATRATIESKAYNFEINRYNPNIEVFGHYCSEWVKIVENNLINDDKSINVIRDDLKQLLEFDPQLIVLGCTHYPYLMDILKKFAPQKLFFDPAVEVAKFLKDGLIDMNLLSHIQEPTEEFYVSSNPEKFMQVAHLFYDVKSEPKLLNFS